MTNRQGMIYDHPQYYEIAFSFRDIPREAAFLGACARRYSDVKVRRMLEIACGFAPHAGALTALGYRYVGLDINQQMLDYATMKWQHLSPRPDFVLGDMANFTVEQRVDFAFVMLGSLYLNTLDEMDRHFDCMASCLRPGALYFLDWCVQFSDPLSAAMASENECERNGIRVKSRFDVRLLDPVHQMYEEVWTMDVNDHGRIHRLETVEHNRAIFPQEFLLFVRSRADFELVGWWRDWDFEQPIGSDISPQNIARPVALLRRV